MAIKYTEEQQYSRQVDYYTNVSQSAGRVE